MDELDIRFLESCAFYGQAAGNLALISTLNSMLEAEWKWQQQVRENRLRAEQLDRELKFWCEIHRIRTADQLTPDQK